MSDFHNRVFAVFTEIRQLQDYERAAYLNRVCGSDSKLRQTVEMLLAGHEKVGDFLQESPRPANPEIGKGEKPGDLIGQFKLLQQIGEGGWGVVFMAEQETPVRRRVAIKVIKAGMDTKSVVARFDAERHALALMDHPSIAKIFDAGTTASGRPYFVMELIRGIKITEYCDQNALTTEERLKLFLQVCQAIQHAHQKGIIHRDIKPSNILVTTSAEDSVLPVVIDFGIAKATTNQQLTDKTFFTAFEMLIGTPAYMSPEQASLNHADVDTRTDIYSLGVLLYELLTGSTPFEKGGSWKVGIDEIRRLILEKEPVLPSTRLKKMAAVELKSVAVRRRLEPPTLIRVIRGDLDWIVLKALEKDRTRRYVTANELGMDVSRFLANEPISARPPSTLYKFRKTVSRNKLLFGAIAAIVLLLVVGIIFISESLAKERERLRDADSEATARALHNLIVVLMAQKKYDDVEQILDRYLTSDFIDKPQSTPFLVLRADFLARRSQWKEAAADMEVALKYHPADPEYYHILAPLLVEANEQDNYQQLCKRILKSFAGTSNAFIADRMAKDCLLIPSSAVDLQLVGKMAETAVTTRNDEGGESYFQSCMALAEYRRKHFNSAIEWARKSLESQIPDVQGMSYPVLAMANYQLKQNDEAQSALAKDMSLVQKMPKRGSDDLGTDWMGWIYNQVLLDEATDLIEPASTNVTKLHQP